MKKISLSVAFLLFGGVYFANAQVGIGTPTPATSSQLDIVASDKGVLIPRVNLTATTQFSPITGTEEESLLVYNKATAGDAAAITAGTNVTPGYYYWGASKWNRIINAADLDTATGPTVGDVIYILDGTEMVFQYWNGTAYTTINLTDLVGAAQSKTLLVKTNTANTAVKQYYLSEIFIVANTANGVYTAPDQAIINGWTTATLPTGVYEIDIVAGVSTNFETILDQTTTIEKSTGVYYTVKEYIEYISNNSMQDGVTKIVMNGTQASFERWNATTKAWVAVDNTAFKTIVTGNETNTTLVKDVVADLTKPIVYTYANENFIKRVAGATESKIEITADMVTSITNNTDVQNAITKILNKGGNVFFTRAAIAAVDNGGTAIPVNSFYTVDDNGVKVLINLADLVANLETKTQIKRSEVAVDGVFPAFADSRTAPVAAAVKKGEIFYEYNSENNKDFVNVTADIISSITNNTDVQNAITKILNQGGNVYYTRTAIAAAANDGTAIPADSFYTVDATGKKVIIDLSGTVMNVITNNAGDIKNVLGDKINKTTIVKTGDTFNGGDVYIYTNTTTIAANSAVTTGITIPAGIVPGTIIGIKVINAKGISANVTDIVVTAQSIAFNTGTGNMYNILGAGTYDVIVEFVGTVTP